MKPDFLAAQRVKIKAQDGVGMSDDECIDVLCHAAKYKPAGEINNLGAEGWEVCAYEPRSRPSFRDAASRIRNTVRSM